MSKDNSYKFKIRNNIIATAKLYQEYLLDKHFLIVYSGKYVEIQFLSENFLHLTGVGTYLSATRFFDLCVSNQLTVNQFFYNSRYPARISKKKVNNLSRILYLFNSDSIILEEVDTDTQFYEIGITELHFTLCFKNFLESNDLYTVCSHRIEGKSANIVEKSKHAYFIDYIFSKPAQNNKYDYMVFSNNVEIESSIILNMLSDDIRTKLNSCDNNI